MPPKADAAIAQHSLGVDAQVFVTDVERGFGRSRAPRQATRQALYMDEEEDFNPDNHPVPPARRLALQRLELEANEEAHVDAGEELGDGEGDYQRTAMPRESAGNITQLRTDLSDRTFLTKIKSKTIKGTERVAKLVEREAIVRTAAHNEELVRAKMREKSVPAFERLAAARAVALAERDRQFLQSGGVPPTAAAAARAQTADDDEDADVNDKAPTSTTTVGDGVERIGRLRPRDPREKAIDDLLRKRAADRRAAEAVFEPPQASAVTVAELEKMLTLSPFGELGRKLQLGLLALPDMQAVVSLLNPLLYEEEFAKSHFNSLEVIESMMMAGARWVDMQRVKMKARLALALDAAHYGSYIVHGDGGLNDVALCGGHEHYANDETTMIVMEFRCVRRTVENNRDEKSQSARRRMVTELGEVYERELRPVVEEADEEMYIYDDVDDDYLDGMNLKDVAKHFIYKVTLVFVEAVDVHLKNETVLETTHQHEPHHDGDASANNDDDDGASSESDDIFAPRKSVEEAQRQKDQMPEYRYDGGGKDDKSTSGSESSSEETEFLPSGKMNLSVMKARVLVGKWHANRLMGWLNGKQRPGPLCFRSYHISI